MVKSKQTPLIRTKTAVEAVSERERRADLKWGFGRLRLLVDQDLRLRLDAQIQRVSELCFDHRSSAEEIEDACQSLIRGYDVLDQRASDAGVEPIPEHWFEFPITDADGGEMLGFVIRDGCSTSLRERLLAGRKAVAWSVEELGRLLSREHLLGVVKIKQTFPGAEIVRIQPKLEKDLSDELPDLLKAG